MKLLSRPGLSFFKRRVIALSLLSIIFTLCLLGSSAVLVKAQDCIALEGFKWPRSYVGVYIAGGTNDIQKQQALFAMSVWVSAQTWFIDSYENQQGTPYLLYLADHPGEGVITLSFFVGEGTNFGGRTIYSYGGQYPSVQIQINLPPDRAQNPQDLFVEDVILHEMGHALGLGHDTQNQQDAMYPSVDSTPESYGLPSTLDLAALYQLAQVSDPSSLGGSFCLSGTVAYGLPPWLQQTQNGFTIVLSPLEVGAKYLLSGSVSPQPVNLGGTAQITMNLTNTGSYPMRVVSASAQPDFESPINSNESLPLAIDAGQAGTVTFSLVIPNTTSVGQHQIIIGIGVAGLATYGWSSHIESKSILVDIAVTQPQPVATYPTTVVPSTTTMNASTATGICIPTTQTVVLISTTYTVPPTTVIQTYYATGPNGQLTTSTTSFTYTNTSFITAGQYGVQTINPCQQTNSETTTSNSNLPAPSGEALIGGFLVLVIAVLAVFIAVSFSNRGRKVKSTNAPPVTARDGRFFCISCGFENPSSNEFCGKCGNKLYPPV